MQVERTSDISAELHNALREYLKSDHPLDQDHDFDVLQFVNDRFPDATSLDGIHDYSRALRDEMSNLDEDIKALVREHASSALSAERELSSAKEVIGDLVSRINSIKERAEVSEQTVTSVSRDIMMLDVAKKNVTLTITTLKRLVMMVNACEQLAQLAGQREYSQTPALILSIKDLETSFEDIQHIPRIDELLKHKNRIFTDLKLQILEDYDLRILLTFPNASVDPSAGPRIMSSKEDVEAIDFNGAAQAVDALGEDIRHEIINKYCLLVIDDYKKQFAPPHGQFAALDFYEKRLHWLTRALKDFTDKHGHLFPIEWIVNGELCMHFCHETRQHFIEVLSVPQQAPIRLGKESSATTEPVVDLADLMITVLIKSTELENDMQRRFDKVRVKLGLPEKDHLHFKGVITSCFEPYLYQWIQYQEKDLLSSVQAIKNAGAKADELMGDAVQLENLEGNKMSGGDSLDSDPPLVYTSSVTIFARFRTSLQRCHQFTTGKIMADLFNVFRKVLNLYLDTVMKGRLPTAKQMNAGNDEALNISCAVIGSLDYCLKMAPHLHKNAMAILDRSFDVSVGKEIQKMADLRDLAQESVVMCVIGGEIRSAMSNIKHHDWWNCEIASSVSGYVGKMRSALETSCRLMGKSLADSHSRAILEQVASRFIITLNDTVYGAKPISETGAQQLLVDLGQIKGLLLELPGLILPGKSALQLYPELIQQGLHRLECSLKALSSPACEERQSLRSMLDSLDPELAQTSPGALDQEVDRLLSLRRGATNSATIHAIAPVTAMFTGGNLESLFERSPNAKFSNNIEPSSPENNSHSSSHRLSKPDLKADLSKLGATIMRSKSFWKV